MTLHTTVLYDTIERCYRAERDGAITGYFETEAKAWATLGVPPAAEQHSTPLDASAPSSSAYQAIALILKDWERMPTGAELYELRVKDPIAGYLWARAVDWTLYQLAQGVPVARRADDDSTSQAYEAARAAALVRLKAIGRDCGAKVSVPDFDSLVAATRVLDDSGVLPPATDPLGDAYRAGYQAGEAGGSTQAFDAITDFLRNSKAERPTVRLERFTAEPDEVDGSVVTGWSFLAGEGDDEAGYYFPDEHNALNQPVIYAIDGRELDPDEIACVLPNIHALLDSKEVQEARRRWHAGLPIVTTEEAA